MNLRFVFILLLFLAFAEVPLKAYVDPGSGVMIWQFLAAGFVGLMFQLRKITGWIRTRKRN